MDPATFLAFEQLGIALVLGLLVGLQRERAATLPYAGLRTFPIVTVLGTCAALLDRNHEAHGWIVAASLLGVVMFAAAAAAQHVRQRRESFGLTTQAAMLLMFVVGAFLVTGDRTLAIAVAAGLAVLLQFKPELHGFARRLGDDDLRAVMQFALITCIVLPVLPNRAYPLPEALDPQGVLAVFNPYETWLMVVLIVGIGLAGYVAYKLFGEQAGLAVGGLLGGAVSSTATTLGHSRRARLMPAHAPAAAVVIVVASTVALLRIIIEIAIVAPEHARELAAPLLAVLAGAAAAAGLAWLFWRGKREVLPQYSNPSELSSALAFAALFAGVQLALAAARHYFGGRGMLTIAVISGLTDMDALTLSTARLVQAHSLTSDQGWRLILAGAMANLCFKTVLAGLFGSRRLLGYILLWTAVPLAAGGAVLVWWPW